MQFDFERLKWSAMLNLFGLVKIPLLTFVTPRMVVLGQSRVVVKIPLNYRTKNHLNVMYFGALAIGAELSIAAAVVQEIQTRKLRVDFIFKDFQANFLRRADGDVHFICDEVDKVRELVLRAADSTERLEYAFEGHAEVPSAGPEIVMKYKLTLSVKNRTKKTPRFLNFFVLLAE